MMELLAHYSPGGRLAKGHNLLHPMLSPWHNDISSSRVFRRRIGAESNVRQHVKYFNQHALQPRQSGKYKCASIWNLIYQLKEICGSIDVPTIKTLHNVDVKFFILGCQLFFGVEERQDCSSDQL